MPLFDVPLQCDMHTSYDFVFAGAWHPDISSFQADLEAHYDLTGTMQLYHDQDFTDGKFIIQRTRKFNNLTPGGKNWTRCTIVCLIVIVGL